MPRNRPLVLVVRCNRRTREPAAVLNLGGDVVLQAPLDQTGLVVFDIPAADKNVSPPTAQVFEAFEFPGTVSPSHDHRRRRAVTLIVP